MPEVDVVTGAFGYTGRYITARLVESGRSVRTLTGHPNRPNPFVDRVAAAAYDFEDRRKLSGHLGGAATLYNTYWVRFPRGMSPSSGPLPTARPSSTRPRMPGCAGSST